MKKIFFLLVLFLISCKSADQDNLQVHKGRVNDLPFVITKAEELSYEVPPLRNLNVIRYPNYTFDYLPQDKWPPYFTAIITEEDATYKKIDNFLGQNRCDPKKENSHNGQINNAFSFGSVQNLINKPEIELVYAINNCNFPGRYRTYTPVEIESCKNWQNSQEDYAKNGYCELMVEMGYAKSPEFLVEQHPVFFEDDEYILRVKNKIYRIRKYKNSTSDKGDALLREMLISADSL